MSSLPLADRPARTTGFGTAVRPAGGSGMVVPRTGTEPTIDEVRVRWQHDTDTRNAQLEVYRRRTRLAAGVATAALVVAAAALAARSRAGGGAR
ncbi:hypothetical protein ACQP2F_33200 [Actinoplanes sp. CA-030573]|uniref:hypothetical protein n=1 Tax=Actinoplanes sp. CA-030573 TaxID=3239898 RepID=UPI003D8CB58E